MLSRFMDNLNSRTKVFKQCSKPSLRISEDCFPNVPVKMVNEVLGVDGGFWPWSLLCS